MAAPARANSPVSTKSVKSSRQQQPKLTGLRDLGSQGSKRRLKASLHVHSAAAPSSTPSMASAELQVHAGSRRLQGGEALEFQALEEKPQKGESVRLRAPACACVRSCSCAGAAKGSCLAAAAQLWSCLPLWDLLLTLELTSVQGTSSAGLGCRLKLPWQIQIVNTHSHTLTNNANADQTQPGGLTWTRQKPSD